MQPYQFDHPEGLGGRRFRRDLTLDLGSAHTVLASVRYQALIREPTLVSFEPVLIQGQPVGRQRVVAVGAQALEQSHPVRPNLVTVAPVERGRIADPQALVPLLMHMQKPLMGGVLARMGVPSVVAVVVPPSVDEEHRSRLRALMQEAGWRRFLLVQSPLAAVSGSGLRIDEPRGRMVLDIGGGATTISVFSMGSVVSWRRVAFGGLDLDKAISSYAADRFGVIMDITTAEAVKHAIGTAFPPAEPLRMEYQGLDLRGHVEKRIVMEDNELRDVLVDASEPLMLSLQEELAEIPPELAGDLLEDGALLVGGGTLLNGLPEYLRERTGIPFERAQDPLNTIIRGAQRILFDTLGKRNWRRRLEA